MQKDPMNNYSKLNEKSVCVLTWNAKEVKSNELSVSMYAEQLNTMELAFECVVS